MAPLNEINILPAPVDQDMAARNWSRWESIAAQKDWPADFKIQNTRIGKLLTAIFGYSPFLSQTVFKHPDLVAAFLINGPEAVLDQALESLSEIDPNDPTQQSAVRSALRVCKQKTALITALADLAGIWDVNRVCAALTEFADLSLQFALRASYAAQFKGDEPDTGVFQTCRGIAALAMGKMGAFELNYSSDIDLFVVFDGDCLPIHPKHSPQSLAVAITRQMVSILQDRTGEGYVFRTDLRLRPDPGSTAIAVSLPAAIGYYESYGQNWERSAMIKARFSAGDQDLANNFSEALTPFVWRKSLDFYALRDIHSLKRQIHVHKGSATVRMSGHNVKLGRGGIREIELFAQIQQLIWGGKEVSLRTRRTLDALKYLNAMDLVTDQEQEDLSKAYVFLRRVEHVLQMRQDEQTHSLPENDEDLTAVARILGFDTLNSFEHQLLAHMRSVEACYAGLFETSESLAPTGNLVFTGTEDDPETLETLEKMGFAEPSHVAALVRGWHTGRMRATRSVRAREILTELHPQLLEAFAATAHPVDAMIRFDACLRDLPSGVQLFSLISAKPSLLHDVADIMGNAPELADSLSRWPSLFEYVISPGFAIHRYTRTDLDSELTITKAGLDYEAWLDAVRQWFNEHKFRIGVQVLQTELAPLEATEQLSNIAEVALCHAMNAAKAEFESHHGIVPDSRAAILAYGKLGAREMTPTSDLDLVFIYDAPTDAVSEGAARSLPSAAYFSRLVQRAITACSSLTRNGRLFELDFRLRPSGESGPLATSLPAFLNYQEDTAWTWEHMALLKARCVWGDRALREEIKTGYCAVLNRPRELKALKADVVDMRSKIQTQHPGRAWWDAKYTRGGLVDMEFLTEYLQLAHASEHPSLVAAPPNLASQALLEAKVLTAQEAEKLDKARSFWLSFLALSRLTQGAGALFEEAPEGLKQRMAKALDLEHASDIPLRAEQHAKSVASLTEAYIDPGFHSPT